MIVYEKASPENTAPTLRVALEKAQSLSTDIVLSTTTGASAFAALEAAQASGFTGKIIIVTHAFGSKEPGQNRLSNEDRQRLEDAGAILVTAAHALSGVERAMSGKFGGAYPTEIIAHALRMLCHGVKVCVEISAMALDAGRIAHDRPIIAVGGTGSGLDTACVVTPAYSAKIFDTKVHELLCKPYA